MRDRVQKKLKAWNKCEKCPLHVFRRNVVLGSGDVPADVFFVGISHGRSEELLRVPMTGRPFRLLWNAMEAATEMADLSSSPSWYMTNLLGCRSVSRLKTPGKVVDREPFKPEIDKCWPRLESIYHIIKPKAIIALGALP